MAGEQDSELRSDYDGAWKTAFKRHLRQFLAVYFPALASEVDWNVAPRWQDRELEQLLARAGRRSSVVDLLVKLRLKSGEDQSFLFHIEVQSAKEDEFEKRLHLYNAGIFFAYGTRIVSMAVLADLNSNWRPSKDFWELGGFRSVMEFPICKLADRLESDWKDRHSLPIEVARAQIAALRTVGDPAARFRSKIELMKSVYPLGYSADDVRELYRLIDHMMLLSEELQLQFRREVIEFEERESMPYITSIERLAKEEGRQTGLEEGRQTGLEEGRQTGLEEGRQTGLEEGRQTGLEEGRQTALKILFRFLARHFGEIPESLRDRIALLSASQLDSLSEAALDMGTFEDVGAWLNKLSK